MKIKGFTIARRLGAEELRGLCIQKGYYTKGTNSEYSHLFDMIRDDYGTPLDLTDSQIIEVAEDIYKHSDVRHLCDIYGCDEVEVLWGILHEVYDACYTLMAADIEESDIPVES